MTNKTLTVGLVIVLIVAVLGFVRTLGGPATVLPAQTYGSPAGETNYNTLGATGLKIGTSCGDSFSSSSANGCQATTHLILKTCNLLGMDVSQPATSTRPYDCAITGVTSADATIAQLGTTTISTANGNVGWVITASKASTTAGYVTVLVANLSGAAAAPSIAGIGSSTAVTIFQ